MKSKNKIRKIIVGYKLGVFIITAMVGVILMTNPVYASALKDSKIVTGSVKLIADLQKVLLGVEVGLTALLEIVAGIKKQAAEQEEKPKYTKQMKDILLTAIFIVAATGLIPIILSYYL